MLRVIGTILLVALFLFTLLVFAEVEPFEEIWKGRGLPNAVLVAPTESDEILANPGMGFTTHGAYDGDVPGYPKSTIAYCRWYWDELEPEEGAFNWAMVDSVLNECRARGQRLATRLMPANGIPRIPDWYRETGAKGYEFIAEGNMRAGRDIVSWMPDHEDPLYIKYMGRLVREFAARYDGHPDIDHLDIGSYGHWGEWHHSFVENRDEYPFETKKMIIDWYLEAFQKTPMVICEDAEEGLDYACKMGTGWRADCIGDYGPPNNWNLMDRYLKLPKMYKSVGEAWKTSPVAFESCGTMESWFRAGRDVEYIWSICLELHCSILNNKSTPVPPECWPATERFLKRMGYRLVPRLIKHEKWLEPGSSLNVELDIDNIGVAPPYRAYEPVIQIRAARRRAARIIAEKETGWDVLKWLPGRYSQSTSIDIPADTPPGRYLVYFALRDPFSKEPAVMLASSGCDAQRWHSWSAIEVVEKGTLMEVLTKTD